MRTTLLLALAAIFITMTSSSTRAAEPADHAGKKLYHVVSFKFKADAPKDRITAVEQAFVALKGKIPAIQTLTWGVNNSAEKKDKSFSHTFIITFKDDKGREEYLPHPDHKAFGATLKGIIDDVMVIDFWGE